MMELTPEKVCKQCMYVDYNGDYALWYCQKYGVYPQEFNYDATACEGFCPLQIQIGDEDG